MYKLASLDAAVQAGFRRLDEKMDRFQNDLHDSQLQINDRINNLDKETAAVLLAKRIKIEAIEAEGRKAKAEVDKRLVNIETWQQVAMAKVGVMLTVLTIIWIGLAPAIRNILGIPN